MALVKCSECGKDISDKAVSCPNCGSPVNVVISPRQIALNQAIKSREEKGYILKEKDDINYTAIVGLLPRKINHVMHAILSIFTAGFWLLIWLLAVMFPGKEFKRRITVSEDGTVTDIPIK